MAGKRSSKKAKSKGPKKMKKRASASKRPKRASKSRAKARPKARPKAKRAKRPAAKAKRPARAVSKQRPAARTKAKVIGISRLPAGATRTLAAKPMMKGKAKMAGKGGGAAQGLLEFEEGPPAAEVTHAPGAHVGIGPPPKKRRSKGGQLNMLDYPGESLTVGMPAPEFSLPSTLGRRVTLSEFRGKRVILYFYPKDDTPGCTMEACGFRDSFPRIESKDAVVLGVSLDDELSHEKFAQKYNLPFPLLADKDAAVSRQYGTYKEKNLYGRSFWGIERTTFVIDREGRVEHVFRRVKVEGHAEEVMATLAL
jgi:peroxiredoxin Q/BCP